MKIKKQLLFLLVCVLLLIGCEKKETTNQVIRYEGEDHADIVEEATNETAEEENEKDKKTKHLIVIDAGHQKTGNFEKEPIGPGATEMKAKVAGGTVGTSTGVAEHEVNLKVALKLEAILLERGYEVIMVRRENDVNISNMERAQIANEANADAFIRIHSNGATDPGANGAMALCQTASNPYNAKLHDQSRKLSECVLDGLTKSTGAQKNRIQETDNMSGINWSLVPTTILEMGYLTNPTEEKKMVTEEYQTLMAEGIANGIDDFFEK